MKVRGVMSVNKTTCIVEEPLSPLVQDRSDVRTEGIEVIYTSENFNGDGTDDLQLDVDVLELKRGKG